MLQNKIYQNFFVEILKTFLVVLFGLSIIALTVRAVSFLELIVESGYPVVTYFKYSFLNIFGIAPKFIPLSFLIALMLFVLRHLQDSEFIILWTSGVKKIQLVNLFFLTSILILIVYITFSSFLTPLALNKSRQLLGKDQLNSFLPTVRMQQFSDSFKGFTFIVENKIDNQLENIFLNDKGNNLKNLSSNNLNTSSTTIISERGIVDGKNLFLINGQIISSKNDNSKNEIINFEQLKIDLTDLSTTTIKKPKLQETSTIKLLNCFLTETFNDKICLDSLKKEILPTLNRRVILPLYIPVISLVCSLLLIKTKKNYLNKISIFMYSFLILLFAELAVRFTGINYLTRICFMIFPFILVFIFYSFLNYKFSKEGRSV